MNYKFTFQDGSESLMHYGVKGMKWGVWNSDTARRYRGARRDEKKARAIDKSFGAQSKVSPKATLDKISSDSSRGYGTSTYKFVRGLERYFDRQPGTSEEVRDRYNSKISSLANLTSTPGQKSNAERAMREVKEANDRGHSPTYYTYGYEKGSLPIAEGIADQVKKSIGSSYDKKAIYGHPKEVSDKIHAEANRLTKEALGDYGRQLVYDGNSGYIRVKDNYYNVSVHSVVADVSASLVNYPDLINKRGI